MQEYLNEIKTFKDRKGGGAGQQATSSCSAPLSNESAEILTDRLQKVSLNVSQQSVTTMIDMREKREKNVVEGKTRGC